MESSISHAVINKFYNISSTLFDLVYPEGCLCCDSPLNRQERPNRKNDFFCTPCWSKVRPFEAVVCPRCAEPFSSQAALSHSPGHLCGDCRLNPPAFSRAITPYPYEETLAKGIQLLKYQARTRLVKCLVDLLVDHLRPISFDCVIAIPLHIHRLRSREFNQSLLLAKGIADYFDQPLFIDTLFRTRETLSQVGLSRKERKKNVYRAFELAKPDRVLGQSILLIDDVYTTGATLREGARMLMNAGAREVFVTALCRMALH